MDLGGAVVKEEGVHWRRLKVPSVVTFHRLSHGRLPLAELLLDQEESFLLPVDVVKWLSLPV